MKEIKALYDRVAALEHIVHNSSRHGTVSEINEKGHKIRVQFGGTDEEPFLSPWVPYSQIAGTRKMHSHPSVGQEVTLFSPSGDWRQSVAVPLQWSDNNPAPSEDASADVDLRGRTRQTQKDGDFKVEIDGVTHHVTKQSEVLVIHQDPETEAEGKDETVDDAHPWKGNRAKKKHALSFTKDGGYAITLNIDGVEHKIKVHPNDGIEHSFDNGKHTITVTRTGIKASVDKGAHITEIKSGGAGDMANGQVGSALGPANSGQLSNELRALMSSGMLGGMLSGGGIGGMLGGQLGALLGSILLTQLTSQLQSMMGAGTLSGALQGGIVHTSTTKVKVNAPEIEHSGDLKVTGSVLVHKVIQSKLGLKGPIIGGFPGDPGDAKDF